ncbi:MAG: DEAD/DEAH box helicase [Chitinophagaceae bacterium]|nr:DEAD/DEAH box helicase [Chitinophagaceae bacterium]
MKFSQYDFHRSLLANLELLGFKKPTDIQFKAIPSILKGEDVLAIAQTGTGKTAAFAIPIIQKLLSRKRRHDNQIRCLVMVPTRELALQITSVFHQLTVGTDIIALSTYGGVSQDLQKEELQYGVDIVVSTPGRMFDLNHQGDLQLDEIEYLILDEADKMLAKGFYKDIEDVVRKIPKRHQTLFFSATINKEIKDLAYSLVRNPIRIQLSPKDPVSKNITHAVASIAMDDKRFFLERYLLDHADQKIMVFVRTKVRAERVQLAMQRVGIEANVIHGGKEQEERESALDRFRNGEVKVLIATDVSARGIDIQGIETVINYDLPEIAENYVHRIGRTGRGREKGYALAFCDESEIPLLRAIEDYIGKSIQSIPVSKTDTQFVRLTTDEKKNDWQKLLDDAAVEAAAFLKKSKRKKKK